MVFSRFILAAFFLYDIRVLFSFLLDGIDPPLEEFFNNKINGLSLGNLGSVGVRGINRVRS